MKIVYVHGWLSNGNTSTVTILKNMLPNDEILSPTLDYSEPLLALKYLQNYIKTNNPDLVIGTSLGGLFTSLVECNKILVNPAFEIPDVIFIGKHKMLNDNSEINFDKKKFDELLNLIEQTKKISKSQKYLTQILIGINDDVVNCTDLIKSLFKFKHNIIFSNFGHRLTNNIIHTDLRNMIFNSIELKENFINQLPIGDNDL